MLPLLVTAYGVAAAGAALFQTRQLLAGRASCEVSARFFAVYAGGYAIWLGYGLSIGSLPLIIVDAIGVVCASVTLAIALSLRGSLLDPSTWNSCPVPSQHPNLAPADHSVRRGPHTAGTVWRAPALDFEMT